MLHHLIKIIKNSLHRSIYLFLTKMNLCLQAIMCMYSTSVFLLKAGQEWLGWSAFIISKLLE